MDSQPDHHMARRDRPRRITVLLGLTLFGALVGVLSLAPARPALIWNFSPSVPQGLYVLDGNAGRRADMVAVVPSGGAKDLLADYGVLPEGRVLIKRVAATTGDIVCRTSRSISVNGWEVAIALGATPAGRPLPEWSGCAALSRDQVFLLADHPASFDGRYFGPTPSAEILGTLHAVWLLPLSAEGGT